MRLKTEGDRPATVNGVQPEIVVAMMVASTVFAEWGLTMTVTSLTDGAEWRSPRSLHPSGLAFDIRVWDLKTDLKRIAMVRALQKALGDEFDVVDEGDHIHVEFDPE